MEVEARTFIEGNLGALDAPNEQGQLLMLLNDGTILVSVFRNTFSGKGRIYAIKPASGS